MLRCCNEDVSTVQDIHLQRYWLVPPMKNLFIVQHLCLHTDRMVTLSEVIIRARGITKLGRLLLHKTKHRP